MSNLPATKPGLVDNTELALEILGPNIIARMKLYEINTDRESNTLPQALFVNAAELRALELLIRQAKASLGGKRRIEANIWGNFYGYEGSRRVKDFGLGEFEANEWLNHRED